MRYIDTLLSQAQKTPSITAISGFDSSNNYRSLTYAEMTTEATKLSSLMNDSNTPQNILIRSGNTLDTFVLMLAAMMSNRASVVINPAVPPKALDALVQNLPFKISIFESATLEAAVTANTDKPDINKNMLFYVTTSGTTGRPKLVEFTDQNLFALIETIFDFNNFTGKALMATPTSLLATIGMALPCFTNGGSVELMPNWDPEYFVSKLEGTQATVLSPAQINMLRVSHPDLSPVGSPVVILAGAKITKENRDWSKEHLSPNTWVVYGTTETSAITGLRPDDSDEFAGSVGKPLSGVNISFSESGEITISRPGLRENFKPGDIGYESEGFIYLTDRTDDLINVGGRKVHPSQVEATASDFPGVQEVVIVAAKHDIMGEVPVAFIVGDADTQALESYLREVLEPYMIPRTYITVEDLPMSPAGKLLRSALRERV